MMPEAVQLLQHSVSVHYRVLTVVLDDSPLMVSDGVDFQKKLAALKSSETQR